MGKGSCSPGVYVWVWGDQAPNNDDNGDDDKDDDKHINLNSALKDEKCLR